MKRLSTICCIVGSTVWATPLPAGAQVPTAADCVPPSVIGAPTGRVKVTILEIDPNSDLEGDDDSVPYYDNHADIFGFVRIDGVEHRLPQRDDNDHPFWPEGTASFVTPASGGTVPIQIEIWEDDWGATGSNDSVDISPLPGKNILDLELDLCSMFMSGDVSIQETKRPLTIGPPDGDWNDAKIVFRVEMEDGKPVTTNELALMEVDIVQVVPEANRLIQGKPAIVRARMANNFPFPVDTDLQINFAGGGGSVFRNFAVHLEPFESVSRYFYTDIPIIPPISSTSYDAFFQATLDSAHVYDAAIPAGDCRRQNDANFQIPWKVVNTGQRELVFAKTGGLLDIGNLVTDADLFAARDLGTAFVRTTYPVADMATITPPIAMIPPATAALGWLTTVLAAWGIPADAVMPFWLVFELNGVATLAGIDRLIGVVPARWLESFSGWGGRGLSVSLLDWAPHAVVVEPRHMSFADGGETDLIAVAHELGHTYGLSVDSAMKDSWLCAVDWPIFHHLPCAAVGGYDETLTFPEAGNAARGFWVERGGEPSQLTAAGMVGAEQCNSSCLMGFGQAEGGQWLDWPVRRRWIDRADYNHLIDALQTLPDPEIIYLSGMIAHDESLYLGEWFQFPLGIPDRDTSSTKGAYALRFRDTGGALLQEIAVPLHWGNSHFDHELPITFFAFKAPLPAGTRSVEVFNRVSGNLLGSRSLSNNSPTAALIQPPNGANIPRTSAVNISWSMSDPDRDPLRASVMIRPVTQPAQTSWWPAAYQVSGTSAQIDANTLPRGTYQIKVIAHDGVRTGESAIRTFNIR